MENGSGYWGLLVKDFDTIAAIATPAGNGAVGIIRLSGAQALEILSKVWAKIREEQVGVQAFEPRRIYFGKIVSIKDRSMLDQVLCFMMKAPSSYTGEDVVEIQGHGGQRVMDLLLENFILAGARPAEPGEFSKRAFLNGRMDLSQAEAIADLIQATSARAVRLAERQLEGQLSEYVGRLRNELKVMRAQMEAMIDFPEDEDVQGLRYEEIIERIDRVRTRIEMLLTTYEEGRFLREGVHVAILGKPNVGKSSLFNALLKQDRAIVHSAPGTTRDVIEEVLDLNGLTVRFMDTAGIRAGKDVIESEGIRRARERLAGADLILVVLDSSRPLDPEDEMVLEMVGERPTLFLYNKIDLPPAFTRAQVIPISAKQDQGIDEVKRMIVGHFLKNTISGRGSEIVLTNLRHRTALQKGNESLERVREASLEKKSLEFLVADLSIAMDFLGEVTGDVTNDEILGEIFSKFCIGK